MINTWGCETGCGIIVHHNKAGENKYSNLPKQLNDNDKMLYFDTNIIENKNVKKKSKIDVFVKNYFDVNLAVGNI